MGKFFEIVKRDGRHGLDLIIESRVTGEVFLLLLDSPDPYFPLFAELHRMVAHVREIRKWVKSGVIIFAGKQVVYNKVYV